MLKLINFATYESEYSKFHNDAAKMMQFMDEYHMDGVELIQVDRWDMSFVPKQLIHGLHMSFWPIWIDFWNGNKKELLRQFGDEDTIRSFYGGDHREVMIRHYKNEIRTASDIGVKYVVFHVSHVELEHSFNYKFTYDDYEVIDATIELCNEIFEGEECDFTLLFENLWWPGLTFLNSDIVERLMNGVNYKNKGFMLDTGHMMNTNHHLKDEAEAVDYILNTINKLGDSKGLIKGIHMNSSLSGEYVLQSMKQEISFPKADKFFDKYSRLYEHIGKVDMHLPFKKSCAEKIVNYINPQYLVYEFITSNIEDLRKYTLTQNNALNL